MLDEEILNRIRSLSDSYEERAYLFVLAALEYSQRRRPVRGHISGAELSWACRDLALEQFGLTARTVFSHWGISSTADIGQIVFRLIDLGLLIQHADDRVEHFDSVFDFADAFDGYAWSGVSRSTGKV